MFAEVEAELRGFLILAKDKGDWWILHFASFTVVQFACGVYWERLSRNKSKSEHVGEETDYLSLLKIEPEHLGYLSCTLVTTLNWLPRLEV
jgi:hypothetical protein